MTPEEPPQENIIPTNTLNTGAEGASQIAPNINAVPGGSAVILGTLRSYMFKEGEFGWMLDANGRATFGGGLTISGTSVSGKVIGSVTADVGSTGTVVVGTSTGKRIVLQGFTGRLDFVGADGNLNGYFISGANGSNAILTDGDLLPNGDNFWNLGNAAARWSLIRGVTITPGDLKFENDWVVTEHDKLGIKTPGLGFTTPEGKLVMFLAEDGLYMDTPIKKLSDLK